jgi:hypothetical protein
MTVSAQLCSVEDKFFINGRGLVVMPGNWQTGQIRPGDWVEIRSPDGRSNVVKTASIEGARFVAGRPCLVDRHNPGGLLFPTLTKDNVQIGDEIWTAMALTTEPESEAALPTERPKISWWCRLLGGQ